MSPARELANRIVRTFIGPMWHGPALAELLNGVTSEQAAQRPVSAAHTIWELVLHIITWVDVPCERLSGTPWKEVGADVDWPKMPAPSAAAWKAALARLEERHRALANIVASLNEAALASPVVAQDYTVAEMLHGVVEHATYHGGQIALLKKLVVRG